MYQSEMTVFLQQLHKKNPSLQKDQREARDLWWDKPAQQPKKEKDNMAECLPAKAYPYYSEKIS